MKKALCAVALCSVVLGLLAFLLLHDSAHDKALARWESREPASYAFTYFTCGGMCAYCPIHMTVGDGVVTDAGHGPDACTMREVPRLTVEDVFDIDARESGWFGRSSQVHYDPVWGFPTVISTTCPEGTSDCGSSWAITDFEVLEPRR